MKLKDFMKEQQKELSSTDKYNILIQRLKKIYHLIDMYEEQGLIPVGDRDKMDTLKKFIFEMVKNQ